MCSCIAIDWKYALEGSFDRLLADNTAIFRINRLACLESDLKEAIASFVGTGHNDGIEVWIGDHCLWVEEVDYDLVTMEVLIPWKDILSAYESEMEDKRIKLEQTELENAMRSSSSD